MHEKVHVYQNKIIIQLIGLYDLKITIFQEKSLDPTNIIKQV